MAQDQRIYDAMRSRLPSARARIEKPTPVQSVITTRTDGAEEMERSEGDAEEVTAGNDVPMDEQ